MQHLREVTENKLRRLRRILVRIQGAMKRAYQDMRALSQRRRRAKRQVRWVVSFL